MSGGYWSLLTLLLEILSEIPVFLPPKYQHFRFKFSQRYVRQTTIMFVLTVAVNQVQFFSARSGSQVTGDYPCR